MIGFRELKTLRLHRKPTLKNVIETQIRRKHTLMIEPVMTNPTVFDSRTFSGHYRGYVVRDHLWLEFTRNHEISSDNQLQIITPEVKTWKNIVVSDS